MEIPPLRRLSDKLLAAFDQACDQNDLEVAEHLNRCLELVLLKLPVGDGSGGGGGDGGDGDPHRAELEAAIRAYGRLADMRRR